MLFNSFIFILAFLPIAILGYFALNRLRIKGAGRAWLLMVSFLYYGWWSPKYLIIILFSIFLNFFIGKLIGEGERLFKKHLLIFGIVGNVFLLVCFKYANFILININWLTSTKFPLLNIILPVGISFFTISQIMYLVDVYEGMTIENNFLNYALFVSFFPNLLAGPIIHQKDFISQFDSKNKILNYQNLSSGLFIFLVGLFKKVIIADTVAQLVNAGFENTGKLTIIEAWVVSISYTIQLYFDFSGYSDMAIGIGRMFNIRLPINFNSPLQSASIIEFWKRWHITLSDFISTYVYTPVLRAFKKMTFVHSLFAIAIAMLISGIWHGAGWTYICWGLIHGLGLILNHLWRSKKYKLNHAFSWLITLNYINFSFIFFRAKNLSDAWNVLRGMFGANGINLPQSWRSNLPWLTWQKIQFGKIFMNIDAHGELLVSFGALSACLYMSNVYFYTDDNNFRPSKLNIAIMIFLILTNMLMINSIKAKEFVYYGF